MKYSEDAQRRVFHEIVHLYSCVDSENIGLLQYHIERFNNMLINVMSIENDHCRSALIRDWFEWAKKDVFKEDEA